MLKLVVFLPDGKYLFGYECACLIHISVSGICYSQILLNGTFLEIMSHCNFVHILLFVECVCVCVCACTLLEVDSYFISLFPFTRM